MCPDCRSPYGYCVCGWQRLNRTGLASCAMCGAGNSLHHAWCQHQPDVIESTSAMRGILYGVLWGLIGWAIIGTLIAAACLFAAHHPGTHSVFVIFLLATLGYLLTTPSKERH